MLTWLMQICLYPLRVHNLSNNIHLTARIPIAPFDNGRARERTVPYEKIPACLLWPIRILSPNVILHFFSAHVSGRPRIKFLARGRSGEMDRWHCGSGDVRVPDHHRGHLDAHAHLLC